MKILYNIGGLMTKIITAVFFRIKVYNQENIPKTGGFILASNHISFYDPPIVGSWSKREVFFLAKKELFKNPLFGYILRKVNSIPITRRGFDRMAIEKGLEVLNNGYGLTIFPEGTRSLTDEFLPPKPGLGMIALSAKCPIVPTYIHGTNSLKASLLGRAKMSVVFGKPLDREWINRFPDEKDSYIAISQAVMDNIQELKNQFNS